MPISDQLIDEWLANMDDVYECYKELFRGKVPFDGKLSQSVLKRLMHGHMPEIRYNGIRTIFTNRFKRFGEEIGVLE